MNNLPCKSVSKDIISRHPCLSISNFLLIQMIGNMIFEYLLPCYLTVCTSCIPLHPSVLLNITHFSVEEDAAALRLKLLKGIKTSKSSVKSHLTRELNGKSEVEIKSGTKSKGEIGGPCNLYTLTSWYRKFDLIFLIYFAKSFRPIKMVQLLSYEVHDSQKSRDPIIKFF